ncbi:MAG: hypothetical protein Q7P63_09180 [Verrucomicrobiota bacterium JB022]|nr:hypothetical protein [Verrucomicrobiota bacterium JB022]
MDVSLKTAARHCAVTQQPFRPGDRRVCLLVRGAGGELERWDVLPDAANQAAPLGEVLCRWTHVVRDPGEASQQRRQLLQGTEDLFLALCGEPELLAGLEDDEMPISEAGEEERATLKYLLALQLERKRVLRAQEDGHYWHIRRKRAYPVEPIDLQPERIAAVQGQLALLV